MVDFSINQGPIDGAIMGRFVRFTALKFFESIKKHVFRKGFKGLRPDNTLVQAANRGIERFVISE